MELKEIICFDLLGLVNDLHEASNIVDSIMFADDANLFCSHQNINNLFSTVNSVSENINHWFKANKLSRSLARSFDKLNQLYLHYQGAYGHKT